MTIIFYTTSDAPEELHKTITALHNTPKNLIVDKPLDLLTPQVTVDYEADLMQATYAYISAPFNRYYFVSNPSADVGKTIKADLTVDPLMSFASALENCACTVVRSESSGVTYVPDPSLPIDPQRVYIEEKILTGHQFSGTNTRYYLVGLNSTF